jgi:hypothetical protein
MAALDEIQTEIEMDLEDPNLQEDDIIKASEFRNNALIAMMAAIELRSKMKADKVDSTMSASSGPVVSKVSVQTRLPKLEITKFKGEITEWQTFWDQFETIVHKTDLPVVNKFTYLKSLLEGEALNTITGLPLTEANYQIARDCLLERYDRPERIIFLHIQSLLNLSVPSSTLNISALWRLRDEINVNVRCLNALGIGGDQYGVFLTPLILSKLPKEIRLEWSREGKGKEKDLNFLLTFLTTEVERRERSEGFTHMSIGHKVKHAAATSSEEKRPSDTTRTGATSALSVSTNNSDSCNFCGKSHATNKCWEVLKLSGDDRHAKLLNSGVCFLF